jgi:hypothetical protein
MPHADNPIYPKLLLPPVLSQFQPVGPTREATPITELHSQIEIESPCIVSIRINANDDLSAL